MATEPRIDPKQWYSRGLSLPAKQALQYYEAGFKLGPEFLPHAWCGVGAVSCALRQFARAERACEQALSLDPRLALAWNTLGIARRDTGRWVEAVTAFERALALAPGDETLRANLAEAQRNAPRSSGARKTCPACEASIPREAAYCPQCAEPLAGAVGFEMPAPSFTHPSLEEGQGAGIPVCMCGGLVGLLAGVMFWGSILGYFVVIGSVLTLIGAGVARGNFRAGTLLIVAGTIVSGINLITVCGLTQISRRSPPRPAQGERPLPHPEA